MLRKLVLASCLVLAGIGAAVPSAWGVGVDAPRVTSYLHQPLRAVVPLSGAEGIASRRFDVHLADAAAFEAAGIEASALAMPLRVTVPEGRGSPRILITSETPVTQSYLELLLSISWPDGQLQAPVTLLLDPPGYALASNAEGGRASSSQRRAPRPKADAQAVSATSPELAPTAADAPVAKPASGVSRAAELEAVLHALRVRLARVEQERDALAERLATRVSSRPATVADLSGVAALLAQASAAAPSSAPADAVPTAATEAPSSGGAVVDQAPREAAPGDDSAFSWLLPMQLALLGVLAILLGLWGWQRWRHGREATYQDVANQLGATETGTKARPGLGKDDGPETATIDEADIYMAYGRYDQAREWLQARLAEQESTELRLKLLTALGELGEMTAMDREAERFAPSADAETRREADALLAHYRQLASARADAAPQASAGASEVDRLFEGAAPTPREPEDEAPAERDVSPSASATPEAFKARPLSTRVERGENEAPARSPVDEAATPASRPDAEAQPLEFEPPDIPGAPPRLDYQLPDVETGGEDDAPKRLSTLAHDTSGWEVEEVAFEPRDLDNEHPAEALAEARHLLAEAGGGERARALLAVAARAEDEQVSHEAKALMRSHDAV